MAKDTPDTVLLHGDDASRDRKDGVADGAVTPGMLVELSGESDQGAETKYDVAAHSTAAGSAVARFALEYSHTGKTIDDDYADGDHLEYRTADPGDEIYALVAAGENVAIGDPLVSDGAGGLQAGDGTQDAVHVAEAIEVVDNSGGADAVRLRIEVM